jgi:hypothetical protein
MLYWHGYIGEKQLKRVELEKNEACYWIRTHRQKTGGRANIPVLPQAQQVLDKYVQLDLLHPNDPVLPILSNQKRLFT